MEDFDFTDIWDHFTGWLDKIHDYVHEGDEED